MQNIKKPILYSPAGDIKKGICSIFFDADGVYLGLEKFGLRKSGNIEFEELKNFIEYCHSLNKKIDITLNAYLKNYEIEEFKNYLEKIILLNPDSIIFSDPSVIILYDEIIEKISKNRYMEKFPYLTLSTQSNTTNYYSMKFWNQHNIHRIVAARELTLTELYQIKKLQKKENLNFELEVFIHGAMCISISGRCLLSLYMTNKKFSKKGSTIVRDANRGECVHPCRFAYLVEESRANEIYPIEEDDKYSYILSSKDLCLLYYIPLFIYAMVDAFKIEGRMKSAFYTSTITIAYRKAIDKAFEIFKDINLEESTLLNYFENPDSFLHDFPNWKSFADNLNIYTELASHRPYTTGFYFKEEHPSYMMPLYENKLEYNYLLIAEYIPYEKLCFKDFYYKTNINVNINQLKQNQFLIFSKNSIKFEDITFNIFCKKGIFKLVNFKIFDLLYNRILTIKHSNYYIIELDEKFISNTDLSSEQIFFIFIEKKDL